MAQLKKDIKPVAGWSSFLGCTKACSDYLGFNYSFAWLSGISGYAFLLNMHPEVCPSSPTAFDNAFMKRNLETAGLRYEVINFSKWDGDLQKKQKQAFEQVQKALSENHPVFGWELAMPEYYLIAKTDDRGYLFYDFDGSLQHCPWDSIATSEIAMGEFCILSADQAPDPGQQIKTALDFFRTYQNDPSAYALKGYTMGTPAYDVWIAALQTGKFDPWGMAYNTQVWSEARNSAKAFLGEIKQRLGTDRKYPALDKAIASYAEVAEALTQVGKLYPFPPQDKVSPENAKQTLNYLSQAQKAEAAGVKALLEFAGGL